MDSFKFEDVKSEKANASKNRPRTTKITTLFRFLELLIFIIILTRFSTQFNSFSLKLSSEHFKGISVTLVSPRFVFLVGNAIVIVLFLISGYNFSEKNDVDFYDEYVDKCRSINHNQEKRAPVVSCERGVGDQKKTTKKKKTMTMSRCKSENVLREAGESLRRSVSEKGRKREDEMSGEEFRRKVEAFIARQQRCLREEEEEGLSSAALVAVSV